LLFGRLALLLLAVARPDGLAVARPDGLAGASLNVLAGAWRDGLVGARPDGLAGAVRATGAVSEMQDTQMSAPPPVKVNW
jgi:hypothetical protein